MNHKPLFKFILGQETTVRAVCRTMFLWVRYEFVHFLYLILIVPIYMHRDKHFTYICESVYLKFYFV